MSADAQLEHKQRQLAEQLKLQQIGVVSWRAPVSLLRLGYRRKARLGVRVVGDQVLVGFRESFSNRVARLDACLTLTPELSRLISPLKLAISELSDPRCIPQIGVRSRGWPLCRHRASSAAIYCRGFRGLATI